MTTRKSDDDVDAPRSAATKSGAEKAHATDQPSPPPPPDQPAIVEYPRMVYRADAAGNAEARLVNSAQELDQLNQSSGSHWEDSPAKVEKKDGE